MNAENYQIIQEMFNDLQQELNEIDNQISMNLVKIQEADYYVKSILEKEDSDYKVFSPRNVESVHKVEITKAREEKAFCEEENKKLCVRKEALCRKREYFKKILAEESNQEYIALNVQENDRQRIARDLHDTSLQNLAHLVHKIELSSMYIDKDPLHAKLELSVVSKNLKAIIEDIRNTIFNLRPMTFDDLGFKEALERLLNVTNEEMQYEMDVDIDNVSCENNLLLVSIYRIVQECITNIQKHAEATKIYFRCKQEDNVCHIIIKDNGKGFTQEEIEHQSGKHFGLSLMKERVLLMDGNMSIDSEHDGTKIEICIPINN